MRYAFVLHGNTFDNRKEIESNGFYFDWRAKVWVRALRSQLEEPGLVRWAKTLRGVSSSVENADKYLTYKQSLEYRAAQR